MFANIIKLTVYTRNASSSWRAIDYSQRRDGDRFSTHSYFHKFLTDTELLVLDFLIICNLDRSTWSFYVFTMDFGLWSV